MTIAASDRQLSVHTADRPVEILTINGADGITPEWTTSRQQTVAYLQTTSGSTSAVKFVAITHDNVVANVAGLVERLGYEPNDITASWLPLYHDMGLVMAVWLPLIVGGDTILLNPFDFLRDPRSFLQVVSRHHASVTTMPNFAFEHIARRVSPEDLHDLDLARLRRANSGGEPIDTRLIRILR